MAEHKQPEIELRLTKKANKYNRKLKIGQIKYQLLPFLVFSIFVHTSVLSLQLDATGMCVTATVTDSA